MREKLNKMIEELKMLSNDPTLLLCLCKVFQRVIGIGVCHLVPPCFNEKIVEHVSSILRETGISSRVSMTDLDLYRATLCFYYNGCPKCHAICCLNDLSVLPEEENALLNPSLCESVSRCVLGGAGIFNLSLLFALLQTSPDFKKDSLILFALENCVKKDKRSEMVEIAKMFFDATRVLQMDFLFSEPRVSADERDKRFAKLRSMEFEICIEYHRKDIDRIQKEKAEEKAAALEEEKSKMPKCRICFGDPIDSPPVYFPITCSHRICCENCWDSKDGGKKLNHICPECQTPFTVDDVWYR